MLVISPATSQSKVAVVFTHPDLDYREEQGLEDRFGVPVTRAQIER